MATIKQCDRCGKTYPYKGYDSSPNAIRIFKRNMKDMAVTPGEEYDLCPECMDKFRRFMDAKLVGEG